MNMGFLPESVLQMGVFLLLYGVILWDLEQVLEKLGYALGQASQSLGLALNAAGKQIVSLEQNLAFILMGLLLVVLLLIALAVVVDSMPVAVGGRQPKDSLSTRGRWFAWRR
jgi:hypothetical protein